MCDVIPQEENSTNNWRRMKSRGSGWPGQMDPSQSTRPSVSDSFRKPWPEYADAWAKLNNCTPNFSAASSTHAKSDAWRPEWRQSQVGYWDQALISSVS